MTKEQINEAFRTFRPGVYRHYKGGLYRALGLVAHHETRQPWVLYVSMKQGSANIRPLKGEDGWDVAVGTRCSPDGVTHVTYPRFELVNESLDGVEE